MREKFLQNLKAIEKGLFESDTFEYLKSSGFNKAELAPVVAEIFKQAIQGALSLEELSQKLGMSSLELEKIRADMELSMLNAKANIKVAQAEALKAIIQAASMVRSVADNAAINQANASVGMMNVVGNATNQSSLTTYASATNTIIQKINTKPMTEFDDSIAALIGKNDDFGSKNVILHAAKTLLSLGEYVELKGISTYGSNATQWLINDELVASNTKNYLFEAQNVGEFKVRFSVKNDKDEFEKDEVILKVIEGELGKEKKYLKKF